MAETGRLCSLCQTEIGPSEAMRTCPACDSPYHRECWDEVGGCGTYGCEMMPALAKEEASGERAQGWGDQKECPRCHKQILSAAVKCRFCKARFPSPAPMSTRDYLQWRRRQKQLRPVRDTAIGVFLFSLLGFTGPLVLLAGSIWIVRAHPALKRLGGIHQVLAYFGLGLSLLYTLVILTVVL
jgi:hypothetical protein